MGTESENEAGQNETEMTSRIDLAAGESAEPWDEGALVLACLAKDRAAQASMVLAYTTWIHAGAVRAYHRAGRPSSCEPRDLVHKFFLEVFTDPFRVLHRFSQTGRSGKLGPFLAKVAFHRCFKMIFQSDLSSPVSASRSEPLDLEGIPDPPHTPPLDPEDVLARVLAEISTTSREILQMALGRGPYKVHHTVREIAKGLGLTVRQVYYRLAKIRRVRAKVMGIMLAGASDEIV
jgi:DNA-directed RNA polymerase specialized sigma24 family protein